jgi:hypothetical protein
MTEEKEVESEEDNEKNKQTYYKEQISRKGIVVISRKV